MVIRFNSKTSTHTWLSNFYESRIFVATSLGVVEFGSVEAAYQCAKHRPEDLTPRVLQFYSHISPYGAKQAGKTIAIRPDWEERKVNVMRSLLRRKFQHPTELAGRLLATGDEELVHLSPWDRFWGVDDRGNGENVLGKLLMERRAALREEHW